VLVAIALVAVGIAFLVPLAWIVLASLDPAATVSVGLPERWTLDNFSQILSWEQTFRPLWNSVLISGGTAVLTVLASVLGSASRSSTRSCSAPACRSPR
jgi:multiple sugar transport system permease protein